MVATLPATTSRGCARRDGSGTGQVGQEHRRLPGRPPSVWQPARPTPRTQNVSGAHPGLLLLNALLLPAHSRIGLLTVRWGAQALAHGSGPSAARAKQCLTPRSRGAEVACWLVSEPGRRDLSQLVPRLTGPWEEVRHAYVICIRQARAMPARNDTHTASSLSCGGMRPRRAGNNGRSLQLGRTASQTLAKCSKAGPTRTACARGPWVRVSRYSNGCRAGSTAPQNFSSRRPRARTRVSGLHYRPPSPARPPKRSQCAAKMDSGCCVLETSLRVGGMRAGGLFLRAQSQQVGRTQPGFATRRERGSHGCSCGSSSHGPRKDVVLSR